MNIKKVIKERGWTLEQLAAEMKNKKGEKGISQAAVSQIISGNPTLDKLQEIASILGISVSELLADTKADEVYLNCPHCGRLINVKIEAVEVE